MANTVRNTRRLNNFNLNASKMNERTSVYQRYRVFVLLFSKKISTEQDIASTKNSYQFLVPKVPVLRRNRATNPNTSTDAFSAAKKAQVLGNLFKLVRFAITLARTVCHWE